MRCSEKNDKSLYLYKKENKTKRLNLFRFSLFFYTNDKTDLTHREERDDDKIWKKSGSTAKIDFNRKFSASDSRRDWIFKHENQL